MFFHLPKPKTALKSLLLLFALTTVTGAFAQDDLLEIEQNDIPGLAGMYEIPGSPPKLMVMIKNPERAGVEFSASALSTQNFDIDLPTPTEVVEIFNDAPGPEFGDGYPKSSDGTLTSQSATEAVQYRFVNYSITELYTWRDIIMDELAKEFTWVSGAGIVPVSNRLVLVVDTREADFNIVREEVETFLEDRNIPREAVRLEEGYEEEEIRPGGGSSGSNSSGSNSSRKNLDADVRPLVAGLEVGFPGGGCTLGWFARSGRDYGFVTANHCLRDSTGSSIRVNQNASGSRVATVYERYREENEAPYDVVFAEMSSSNFTEEVAWPATGGTLDYSNTKPLLSVTSERYLINGVLYITGQNSGRQLSSGVAGDKFLDFRTSNGLIYLCTKRHITQGGDSGGPWVLVRNGKYYLAGIHRGRLRLKSDGVNRSCFTTANDAQRHLNVNFLF